ncbi:metal-dependent transcriptional regulator [Marivirga atlantica]|jgi:DtxR family Mn-dependent transcriptional regulator|uniref:Transcriptional regulator MntR n=1 Tax=Marivirga atlantica TaxID=1548457 RepID=A0A937AB63_9BACT|nr:metal-dependent transcriptional regulator [Marivirga atlantica]MBL0766975.1 metal-dependent transcriptional regulator [Marivirga atlantica]
MKLSLAEENYLKAVYHLSAEGETEVSTNAIAEEMQTKAASVSDMMRRLSEKELVHYKKYQGVRISNDGARAALQVVRKHRLWEVFLVEKLKFSWDQVHEIAEQLEHIKSPLLIKRLDEFLGHPKYDPHGDPIPDENGEFKEKPQIPLSSTNLNDDGIVVAVKDTSPVFLQHLDRIGIYLGAKIKTIEKTEFDGSMEILIDQKNKLFISKEVAQNVLVTN